MSTIPALYRHLVDDAAMFPPGELPLVDAVAAHREHRQAEYADLVGPFVCTDENLMKVAAEAAKSPGPLEVSVVITGGAGGIEPAVRYGDRSANLIVKGVEVRLRAEEDLSRNALRVVRACDDCLDDENAFVEIGLEGAWERALDVVADAGYAAKLRTGGLDASLFPTAEQIASFITACLDREVAFKCTAGLHNAVRHTAKEIEGKEGKRDGGSGPEGNRDERSGPEGKRDERSGPEGKRDGGSGPEGKRDGRSGDEEARGGGGGFEHQGFLNVLLATRASLDGAGQDEMAVLLEERDGKTLAVKAAGLSEEQAVSTRRWFTSFGSCSIDEPRQDLIALGLLETK